MQGISNFDGIASGLDTTKLVDAIMTAERGGAALLEARAAQKTNELSTYSSLEALLVALKSEVSKLSKSQNFDISKFSVSDDTVLDASAPGLVTAASYDIEVKKLAQAHQIASQGFGSLSDKVGTGTFTVQAGTSSAVTVTLDDSANTLADLRDAINAAGGSVQASIINDGSGANAYRLVLTGKSTGLSNRLTISQTLSGGQSPDFATSRFDSPETLFVDGTTTSQLSLGATASYSGTENKTYTLTVQGQGAQTLGQGEVTVEWSDGVHTGTILVNQADTEVTLAGAGADGLKVSFSAGVLHAGDTFQVQSFSPQLQAAQDAEVAVGTQGNGASPITLRGNTNTLVGALPGITLKLKKTTDLGEKVTVTAGPATDTLNKQIHDMVARYNDVMAGVDKQFTYNDSTQEVGTLIGDSSLLFIQSRLRSKINGVVDGLSGTLKLLSSVGIRADAKGQLQVDEAKLDKAIQENWEGVRALFSRTGNSSNKLITFISGGASTRGTETGYDIDITKAATKGSFAGNSLSDPAVTPLTIGAGNNTLTISSDGLTSDALTITAKTYTTGASLAQELQAKIEGDSKLKGRGIGVTWVSEGSQGHLLFTSGTFGSGSTISVAAGLSGSATDLLGLSGATAQTGSNVEGTINGEAAKGVGQLLTGLDGNKTTAGLALKVELKESDVASGSEGKITYTRGLAAGLDAELDSLTDPLKGFVTARQKGIQAQIADIKDQVTRIDARLAIRRDALVKKFAAMEEAIGQFQAQGNALQSQIASLSNNYTFNQAKK